MTKTARVAQELAPGLSPANQSVSHATAMYHPSKIQSDHAKALPKIYIQHQCSREEKPRLETDA